MEYEDNYAKFRDLTIVSCDEVFWHTVKELKCEWNGKNFTLNNSENSNERELIWMEGKDQFTSEEIEEIEEYMWSGDLDLSTT